MKTLLLMFTFLISTNLTAQTDSIYKKNCVQVTIGTNQVKEANLHPKVHNGAVLGLSYAHEKIKNKLSKFDILFQFSKIKTTYENSSISMNIQISANYGYLFEVINNSKFSFYSGASISAHYRLSYYPNWDDSHLYWANDFSLALANRVKYSLSNKSALSFDIRTSILSVFSRPQLNRAYKIDDVTFAGIIKNMNSNFEVGTINKAFDLHLQAEYQIKISQKVSQAIVYYLEYSRFNANGGMPFTNLQHNIGLKIYF